MTNIQNGETFHEIWKDFKGGGRTPMTTAWHIHLAVDVQSVEKEPGRLYLEGSRNGYVMPLNGEERTKEFHQIYHLLRIIAKRPKGGAYARF